MSSDSFDNSWDDWEHEAERDDLTGFDELKLSSRVHRVCAGGNVESLCRRRLLKKSIE